MAKEQDNSARGRVASAMPLAVSGIMVAWLRMSEEMRFGR